jgi:YYY domain-containing protein
VIRWRPLALFGIAFLGQALRLYGLDWDQIQARYQLLLRLYGPDAAQGNNFHPDERQILFHVVQLSWPSNWAQFFNPTTSPLNPHFFAYGSFPLYLLAAVGNLLSRISTQLGNFASLTLTGRALNAIFDCGTILLAGWLGLLLTRDRTPGRRYAWSVALLAAALVAFTPLQVQLSHFYAVDTLLLFFVTLTVLACVVLVDTDKPVRWSLIAGLGYGLALATKFSAAPLAVPLCVALAMRWYRYGFSTVLVPFVLSVCATLVVFLIAMPYALLDMPEFIQQVAAQGDLARGALDLPYVRQFAGTTPYVYESQNMLFWGMGLTLGLAAFAGFLWLGFRVWKRDAGLWLVVMSWVVVYGAITGSFYVKFMRYMLPIYPFLTLMAASVLVAIMSSIRAKKQNLPGIRAYGRSGGRRADDHKGLVKIPRIFLALPNPAALAPTDDDVSDNPTRERGAWSYLIAILPYAVIAVVLAGTMFQGLALLNVYSQPDTRIQASRWIYSHLQPGSVLTYEQWDDPLPEAVDNHDPSIYQQATYLDANGQPQTGLDLYGDDTTAKAQQFAHILPGVNAITMATDRLDKSIPRIPCRYPLTIHYYQLLFSGQLGFHLAAQFENHPNLFGIVLDDSNADESYSVFDHPTARIFVRDNPYPYTPDQLFHKLLQGVQLPPSCTGLAGVQHSLLLSAQQITGDQQSPPFGIQFPANSLSNTFPVFFWWLVLTLLGLLTYPLVFAAFRGLADRGYIFSKTLGILLLAYFAWILASLHLVAFSHLSTIIVVVVLLLLAIVLFFWQRRAISKFLRQRWRLLLIEEGIFTLAFLLFVGIRSLNPDLWHIYLGGEKPMELAFLNAVLRSPSMPPYDPWFAGGYINYYYYGYIIIGALIKLTSIVPTVAFNLAIPTLFALTFTGAVALVYSFTQLFPVALLGGYFAALIGNFDGLIQLKNQLYALLTSMPVPAFDYWHSSRIIPFTINEFPFWSFLFADLHPHVIDMPIAVLMLGIVGTMLLSGNAKPESPGERRWGNALLYLLAAFVFGTIACVNPWDTPVYALILGAVLIIRKLRERRGEPKRELFVSLVLTLAAFALLCGLGYLFYWPFYAAYQQLYVNGLGLVNQGTGLGDYLTISGLWVFIVTSFFLYELYRWWTKRQPAGSRFQRSIRLASAKSSPRLVAGYLLLCGVVLTFAALLRLKALLVLLIVLGIFLFIARSRDAAQLKNGSIAFDAGTQFTFLLLLVGLCISLGLEIVYVRDFLDGSINERMNTVFKFSIQAWLCFAIGGAIAVQRLWRLMGGFVIKGAWAVLLVFLVLGGSVFLAEGTAARIRDHQAWAVIQPPSQSANYTPTLDGAAFIQAWYPGDARAIAWLNATIAGSPVVLEAAAPLSYTWFNRVSVYTGLPDVLGWPDHVDEQRYAEQPLNRMVDIGIIYTTTDSAQALELLHYYHVRYIYVGDLERQIYAQQSTAGLDKFDRMVGDTLSIVYRAGGVTIYEVMQ